MPLTFAFVRCGTFARSISCHAAPHHAMPCHAILMLYSRIHFAISMSLCLCLLPAAIQLNRFVLNFAEKCFALHFLYYCVCVCDLVECSFPVLPCSVLRRVKCAHTWWIRTFHLKIMNAWTVYGNVPSKFMCIDYELAVALHSNYKCKWAWRNAVVELS